MSDLDKALADIVAIRSRIAADTVFRGYGPAALAATGGVALLTALAQALWLADPTASPLAFVLGWVAAAVVSGGIVWWEMRRRAHRHHSGLADAMIHNAAQQFLPSAAAGLLLAAVLLLHTPESVWMLPGLWQLLVGIGIFASARTLPRGIVLVGGWYFAAGLAVLMLGSADHALSPWTMGLPFLIGQGLMAAILRREYGADDARD
ncbi:MAG: hypothetical protein HOH66_16640 [Rhodospirillaceae bacterium]|jgi:hypothetical protein|nr:hypothetical protein [Rhodospirillaceae bacterium]MBT6119491.1 hypothetical protein [Rhodospirillaceae bacterium]